MTEEGWREEILCLPRHRTDPSAVAKARRSSR